ncbi:MAG: hypothetical protein U9N82_06365, partial [Thermodesulfobacteriota bacterium]|nr:hypothetical protein [Thermodesulfobacteriota bacterium]
SKLVALGFEGPFRATKHQYMIKGKHKIFIPNPHGGKNIGTPLSNNANNRHPLYYTNKLNSD